MYTPQSKGTKDYTESIDEFRGLDLNERISSGFLAWTRNCSSRRYPTVSARLERGWVGNWTILCMCALDGHLYFLDDKGDLYRDNPYDVPITHIELDAMQDPYFVTMGAYIILFPYGYYWNTTNDIGGVPEYWDAGYIAGDLFNGDGDTVTVSYTMCNSQGDGINATVSPTAPSNPQDGDYWIDTSAAHHVLKRWSAIYNDWTQIPNTFTKIASTGIGANIKEMDAVEISGSTYISNETYPVYYRDTDYIVVPYFLEQAHTNVSQDLVVSRNLPEMDYVVELGNRLWGCRYVNSPGTSASVNEIYACALGDFKNWNRFMGLSTDSYVASRGCDGEWTGAVAYLDMVVFFKADHIEIVHPSDTGAHRIETLHVNGTGVAPRSGQSVVVVDNVVYYHGLFGFYAFTGNVPQKISAQLGENVYSDAVAGELNGVYYVCVTDTLTDERHLFTYDTKRGIWYREDEIDIKCFARNGNELYFATPAPDSGKKIAVIPSGNLFTVRGTVGDKEPVTWIAVTHDFAYSHVENKNAKRVYVRANVTAGRKMKVSISYDSSYVWEDVGEIVGDGVHKYVDFPIVPARCDHYRLKFECDGDGCIWSVITRFDDHD